MRLHPVISRIRIGLLWLVCAETGLHAQEAAPRYYFSTSAGLASAGTRDGPADTAQFNRPRGLTLDPAGNLFVLDGSHTLRRISPTGVVTTLAGKPGDARQVDGPAGTARLRLSSGIAVNRSGLVYVTGQNCVRQVNADGSITTLAGVLSDDPAELRLQDGTGAAARFNSLAGLTIDATGTLFAGDTLNGAIRRISPAGVVTTLAGSGTRAYTDGVGPAAAFRYPEDLTIDSSGTLYVTDGGASIRKVAPDGTVTTWAGTPNLPGTQDGVGPAALFQDLWSVAADQSGKIYAAEGMGTIRAITPAAVVTTFAGSRAGPGYADGTGAAAAFANPADLAVDAAGNVYVADEYNNVIRKITPAGSVSTLAGVAPPRSRGATDGPGVDARFNDPRALAAAADGSCYVADSANHVIRKLTPGGIVSTLAGSAGQAGYVDGAGAAARFDQPEALAVDGAGNVYVIDRTNAVRKITPAGVVSTLVSPAPAGSADLTCIAVAPSGDLYVGEYNSGAMSFPAAVRRITPAGVVSTDNRVASRPHSFYSGLAVGADGTLYVCDRIYSTVVKVTATGSERFSSPVIDPTGIALDPAGRIFVSGNNGQVGRIDPDGHGEILGGTAFQLAQHDGVGTDALFHSVRGIAVPGNGTVYVACSDNTIRQGVRAAGPVISVQPGNVTVTAAGAAQFAVSATAVPAPTYQWFFNNQPISGATAATYSLGAVQPAQAGDYHVVVTNALGSVTSSKAALTVTASAPPAPTNPGGGGGGAPSLWFLGALAALAAGDRWRRRRLNVRTDCA